MNNGKKIKAKGDFLFELNSLKVLRGVVVFVLGLDLLAFICYLLPDGFWLVSFEELMLFQILVFGLIAILIVSISNTHSKIEAAMVEKMFQDETVDRADKFIRS